MLPKTSPTLTITMEPKREDFQSFNSFPIIFNSSNINFSFKQIAIVFSIKIVSKYSNSNLELLLSLRKQVTQEKSEFGLLNFPKNRKQNIRRPYYPVFIENSFLGSILIGDMHIADSCLIQEEEEWI